MLGIFSRGHTTFELGKPLENLWSSYYMPSQSYLQHLESSHIIFLQLKAKSNMCFRHTVFPSLLFPRYAKIVNGTTHLYLIVAQQLQMVQSYSKREMSHQTLRYLRAVVDVCTCSNSIISQSVQLLFSYTM